MATSVEPSATISPSEITSDYIPAHTDFGTPSPESAESTPGPEDSEHGGGKKRKSWGQPIPEYQAILPPGKRAKTEEEKEQRRCERIVRNRKAAATSRDRKKAEFERLEQENRLLREQLAQQQAIIQAMQNGQPLPAFSTPAPVQFTATGPPTPASLSVESQTGPSTARASSPAISVISLSNRQQKSSPTLTPSLFVKNEPSDTSNTYTHESPSFDSLPDLGSLNTFNAPGRLDEMINHTISNPQSALESFTNIETSGLTQYPAAVLCEDLQCQPELTMLSSRSNNKWINSVLIIQLMVLNVMSNIYSKTMLSTMSQILTSLEQILPRLLSCRTTADMILPLMHSLITLPTTETPSRRVFRMAFLRRLLACSPASASPLSEAIARALQRQSSAEAIKESSRDGLSWASLMTMRWAIMCVEREMTLHKQRLKVSPNSPTNTKRSFGRQEPSLEGTSIGSFKSPGRGTCTPGTHVH